MADIPAERLPSNLRRSVFKYIAENIRDDAGGARGWTYPVDFNDAFFDADNITDHETVLPRFISLRAIEEGAGSKGDLLIQFDCVGRVGKAASDDRYGADFEEMVDRLRSALNIRCLPVFVDFPSGSPAATSSYLLVQAFGKRGHGFGQPQQERVFPRDGVRMRTVLTYRFRMPQDASGAQYV